MEPHSTLAAFEIDPHTGNRGRHQVRIGQRGQVAGLLGMRGEVAARRAVADAGQQDLDRRRKFDEVVELKNRRTGEKEELSIDAALLRFT